MFYGDICYRKLLLLFSLKLQNEELKKKVEELTNADEKNRRTIQSLEETATKIERDKMEEHAHQVRVIYLYLKPLHLTSKTSKSVDPL